MTIDLFGDVSGLTSFLGVIFNFLFFFLDGFIGGNPV